MPIEHRFNLDSSQIGATHCTFVRTNDPQSFRGRVEECNKGGSARLGTQRTSHFRIQCDFYRADRVYGPVPAHSQLRQQQNNI